MKNISNKTARIVACLFSILPIQVFASAEGGGHSDLFASVLLMFFIVLLMATIGRALARAMGQAPVLGELVIGVIIGNIGYWLGRPFFTIIMEFDTARLIVKEAWRSGLSYQAAAEKVIPVETLHDHLLRICLNCWKTNVLIPIWAGILRLLHTTGVAFRI